MNTKRRNYVLTALALLVLAVVMRLFWGSAGKPEPNGAGYYTGVMKAKGRNSYGTENGASVPPPAGASANNTPSAAEPAGP